MVLGLAGIKKRREKNHSLERVQWKVRSGIAQAVGQEEFDSDETLRIIALACAILPDTSPERRRRASRLLKEIKYPPNQGATRYVYERYMDGTIGVSEFETELDREVKGGRHLPQALKDERRRIELSAIESRTVKQDLSMCPQCGKNTLVRQIINGCEEGDCGGKAKPVCKENCQSCAYVCRE
jgi:hypothetical protein